jgi:hypothetical protein
MPRITIPFATRDLDPINARWAEMNALSGLVDDFARAMKQRLFDKLMQGKSGWDNPASEPDIAEGMRDASRDAYDEYTPGAEIDTANYAMMLWNLRKD